MKKVLILAYDFPPYVSVGGLRPYAWFKYLNEFGIYPIVVTRQWSNSYGNALDYVAPGQRDTDIIEEHPHGTLIRTPYKPNLANRLLLKHGPERYRFLRKIISAWFEFSQFVWITGPKSELYKSAERYLATHPVDVIVATGDPFVLFHYADKLAHQNKVPWIADYRDPWSQDIPLQRKKLLKFWSQIQEKRLMKRVSEVITVSEFVADKIREYYPDKEIHVIPNGYDPELIDSIAALRQNPDLLSIGYAGTIYDWHPIEPFIKGLHQWVIQSNLGFRLNFYGINNQDDIEAMLQAKFPELRPFIHFYPRMANEALLHELAKDNVLLLFNYYSFMGTKIYDYLGLKRRILFCFTQDSEAQQLKDKFYTIDEKSSPNAHLQEDLIVSTESGVLVRDAASLTGILNELAQEFDRNRQISCESIDTSRYSRRIRTKELAAIIHTLVEEKQTTQNTHR